MKVFLKEYYNSGHEHSVQLNRWNKRIDKDYNELKGGDRTLMKLLDFAEKLYLENQELKKINNYEYNKKLSIYGIDMPYKTGKLKGELTSAEIRRLISAHNKLSKITIPKGTDRDGLLKLVETNGFRVDHKNEKLIQTRAKPLMKVDLPPKKTRAKKEEKKTLKYTPKEKPALPPRDKPPPLPPRDKKEVTDEELYPDTRTPQQKKLEKIQEFMEDRLKFMTKKQNKKLTTEQIKTNTRLIKNMFTQITKNTKSNTDLPSKLMKASEKLLNVIYSNPPNPDKVDGVVLDFKSPALKPYKSYLSETAIKKNRNTLNSYKPKKPKKQPEKKLTTAEAKKLLGGDLPKEDYGGQPTQKSKRQTEKDDLQYRNFRVDIEKRLRRRLKNYEMKIEEDDETNPTKEDVTKFIKSINEMIKNPPQVVNTYTDSQTGKEITKKEKQLVLNANQKKELNKLVKEYEKDYNELIDEIEEEDGKEPITNANDRKVFEVKTRLQRISRDMVKKFRNQTPKPTRDEIEKAVKQLKGFIPFYENKNNVEFVASAGRKISDLLDIYVGDIRNYK